MKVVSKALVWLRNDIDTDQIIPARFLKTTSRAGLGRHLFADRPDAPRPEGTRILVAGDNFGCGSSREHAPWALLDAGIQAIIALSFADIFRGNALKNGLIPVALEAGPYAEVAEVAAAGLPITVDIDALTVSWPGGQAGFWIDPFARKCLLAGVDELGYLLSLEAEIARHETAR